jgi:hypothetical protein
VLLLDPLLFDFLLHLLLLFDELLLLFAFLQNVRHEHFGVESFDVILLVMHVFVGLFKGLNTLLLNLFIHNPVLLPSPLLLFF